MRAPSKPRRYQAKFSCLKACVEAADAAARKTVFVCRCPHCSKLLILPEQPVEVAIDDLRGEA